MLGRLENHAAIGTLALEHAARVMQPVRQNMQIGVGPRDQLAVVPNDAVASIKGLSHIISPRDRSSVARCFRVAAFASRVKSRYVSDPPVCRAGSVGR